MLNILNKYFYKYPKFDKCNKVFERNYHKFKICKSCENYLASSEASCLERILNLSSNKNIKTKGSS
jgi:hypothetical protein